MRPIGIDLFAGAGGMSLGFEQAGFDVVAAVEIDPIHAAVHKFNFPDCTVIPRSVTDLTGEQIRKMARIENRDIDVVFGGAPCQGFSMIGRRALDDPRNSLVRDFVRLVDELGAKYFVFENVKGLTVGRHRKFLTELIEAFESKGYSVNKNWQVLNASSFGVPQDRQRFILMGARSGAEMPLYPTPDTHSDNGSKFKSMMGPSCHDALSDLPDAELFDELLESDEVRVHSWKRPSDYAKMLRCVDELGWYLGYRREWEPKLLTSSMRTVHTSISRRRFAETEAGKIEPISRFFKLPPNGVSNTLRAGTDASRGAFTSPRPIHYSYPRCITVREMARLHGFPDWFRFHVTKWHGARQIGNAVPPPLARAVAMQIVLGLGVGVEKPSQVVALGSEKLLKMDMSEASKYWNVPKPTGKRDRKSGDTKRKQSEIEVVLNG